MAIARVQARGQVTVPQDIREACGITPGTLLVFSQTGPHEFGCRVLPGGDSLTDLIEEFTVDGVAPDLEMLRDQMGDDLTRH